MALPESHESDPWLCSGAVWVVIIGLAIAAMESRAHCPDLIYKQRVTLYGLEALTLFQVIVQAVSIGLAFRGEPCSVYELAHGQECRRSQTCRRAL